MKKFDSADWAFAFLVVGVFFCLSACTAVTTIYGK